MENEERYEIREKIGQGGVGAVYRAFDKQLNREVAIKRVLAGGGYENQDEATKAMLKEATALCSVQHPNIVTVFDSGVDEDGPFVVMELLSGRTIDEMVERGTLTFQDFREVALQSQEALIAAQDLDLVHRDIKPTNVMVTWLPSGRFQVKLVDFGLAKFSPKPSLQTIDHGDAVFGSIHFMAPEQFERTELDKRTDLYSMGCVYYFTLAGKYPFDGETAPQVMAAHLNHTVTPLGELRPDLPGWLCDWVMWHLERKMTERPADAREALAKFLMSENSTPPAPGKPDQPAQPAQAARPKLIIPGAQPTQPAPVTPPEETPAVPAKPADPISTVPTLTAPQPILPPEGARPSVHTQAQQLKAPPAEPAQPVTPVAPVEPVQPAPIEAPKMKLNIPGAAAAQPAPVAEVPVEAPAPVEPVPAPVLVAPDSAPAPAPTIPVQASVQASEQITVSLQGATPPITAPLAGTAPALDPLGGPIEPLASAAAGDALAPPAAKKGLSTPAKAMIAVVLSVGLIIATLMFISGTAKKDRIERLNRMTSGVEDAAEVEMSRKDLSIILNEMITPSKKADGERAAYQIALSKAVSSDGQDIDVVISEFVTQTSMNEGIRSAIFDVLGRRKGESALPALVEFAGRTESQKDAKKAIETAGKMATSGNFSELLKVVSLADDSSVKNQAVGVLSKVISGSDTPSDFAGSVVSAYENAIDPDTKGVLLRLLGASGGSSAAEIVTAEVEKDDLKIQLSAIAAMRQWPDDSMFETLRDVADGQEDNLLRKEAFDGLIDFLKKSDQIEESDLGLYWKDISKLAVSETEQFKVVQEMGNQKSPWAKEILDYFINDQDANATDKVIMRAEKAERRLQERIRLLNRGKK